ncbi:MAG: cell division protein SepF [Oscillospiraceae bacterium]|nr:cell division protein SepF [Oscillospiraceae bacterium]
MSNFAQKFKNMWNPPEDEFDYEEAGQVEHNEDADTDTQASAASEDSYRDIHSSSYEEDHRSSRSNVVNFGHSGNLEVVLFKPMDYGKDTRAIADELVRSNTVVLNLEVTPKDTARRILDFLGGVAYAKDGTVKRVSTNTYIITPSNVRLSGDDMTESNETEETYL